MMHRKNDYGIGNILDDNDDEAHSSQINPITRPDSPYWLIFWYLLIQCTS